MKKLLFGLLALVALSVSALDYREVSFINGNQVWFSNNTTTVSSDAGVLFSNLTHVLAFSQTNLYLTNITSGNRLTNANIGTFGSWTVDANSWPLADGGLNTNLSIGVVVVGDNAASTNSIGFTFCRMVGTNVPTSAQDKFTFSLTANATTPVVLTTNLPPGFCVGNQTIRLLSVLVSSISNSTNLVVPYVKLRGWVP